MYLPLYAKLCGFYRKFNFFHFAIKKTPNLPELMNCIPIQKEITYLWHDMAKNKNHADFDV